MLIVSARGIRAIAAGLFVLALGAAPAAGQEKAPKEKHALPIGVGEKGGDFDALKKRRNIRVLVVYNKTNYFIDKGAPRGITYEAFKMFEDELNKKYKTGNVRITCPSTRSARDELAAGPPRRAGRHRRGRPDRDARAPEKVDFSIPAATNVVNEIVVTGPRIAAAIATADDLAGQEVFVRKSIELLREPRAAERDAGQARQEAGESCGSRPTTSRTRT